MLTSGAWLFPELSGQVYLNKPTLHVWLIALVSEIPGQVTQLTAALPSALAAVGLVAVVYAFGRDLFGPRAGRDAALAAAATQGFVLHARLALPDMLMTCFVTASVWMLGRMTRGDRFAWIGFYGFAAAAFWAKGPAGLLSLVVAVAWVLVAGRPFRWSALALARGVPLLFVLIAPWWLMSAAVSRAGAADAVVVDQLLWYLPGATDLGRFVDPFRNAFGVLFPWVLVAPVAAVSAVRCVRGRAAAREGVLLVLVYAVVLFVAVALSNQQRFRYYLPVLPPVALLIGWWATAPRRSSDVHLPWKMYGALGLALAGASVMAFVMPPGPRTPFGGSFPASPGELILLGAALGIMIAALVDGARHARLPQGFVVAWIASAVLVLSAYHLETGRLNIASDYPRLAQRLAALLPADGRVAVLDVHALPIEFYLRRPVDVLVRPADVAKFAARPGHLVVVRSATLAAAPGRETMDVVLEDRVGRRPISVVRGKP